MALDANDLARIGDRIVPLLVPLMREIRAGSGGGGGTDARADAKLMFGDAARRPALLSRIGLVEGVVGEGEFYGLVDSAAVQL
jgi:hypothetical protein